MDSKKFRKSAHQYREMQSPWVPELSRPPLSRNDEENDSKTITRTNQKKEDQLMKSFLKVLFLGAVVFGLMAGQAFGQAALNAGNTTLAAEKIPPAVAYPAASVNTAYQTGGPIAASTVIKISLTNGAFVVGSNLSICKDGAPPLRMNAAPAVVPASPNNTSVNILLTEPLASGTVYTIQHDGCAVFPLGLNNVLVNAGSAAGTTVSLAIDSVTTPGDPNVLASGTVLNVVNQFTVSLEKVVSKISFASNQNGFVSSGAALPLTTATQSEAAITITSNEAINDKIGVLGAGACSHTLAGPDSVKFKISGNFVGLANIIYDGAVPYAIQAADRTAGAATLTVTGDALRICSSTDPSPFTKQALALEIDASTSTQLLSGVRTAQISLSSTGGLLPAGYTRDLVAAGAASHDFQLDATQFYVQLIKFGTGVETFIKLQSKSTVAGSGGVNATILAADGTMVPFSAGTIVAGTPFTITGTELAAAVIAAGKSVSPAQGFAAIITVNAPIADVFGYANTCDASGCKRIPLKIGYTASSGTFIVE